MACKTMAKVAPQKIAVKSNVKPSIAFSQFQKGSARQTCSALIESERDVGFCLTRFRTDGHFARERCKRRAASS